MECKRLILPRPKQLLTTIASFFLYGECGITLPTCYFRGNLASMRSAPNFGYSKMSVARASGQRIKTNGLGLYNATPPLLPHHLSCVCRRLSGLHNWRHRRGFVHVPLYCLHRQRDPSSSQKGPSISPSRISILPDLQNVLAIGQCCFCVSPF